MAEELKHLIEQIQKEGVEKANEQAETIISQAKEKAAKIVAEAEETAQNTLEKAEAEAEAFSKRSIKTLEQAARDLLITVGQGCEKVVTETLGKKVSESVSGELLQNMILSIIDQNTGNSVTLSVSDSDKEALATFCSEQVKSLGKEIELVSDSEVLSGFKIGFKDKNVYLDFTSEALSETLASFLRPELAKIISRVAREQISNI